jgi:tRNA-guanine family transglycosylase
MINTENRQLITRRGAIPLPAYIPVTTFGKKYPLDDLVRPYLPRLASAVMVSYHYARQQTQPFRLPMLVDSGGFVSLFERAKVIQDNGLGCIHVSTDAGTEVLAPSEILQFQEERADVAFTLDFPIPPTMESEEAKRRLALTIANAHWALANRRRRDLPLFACIQGWDLDSYLACAKNYLGAKFDGLALGGMVPRMRDKDFVLDLVTRIKTMHPELPLHVFGLGQPELVASLIERGADSVDSSAYVKLAAEGRLWGLDSRRVSIESPLTRLHLALCNLAAATNRVLPVGFASNRFESSFLQAETTAPHSDNPPHLRQARADYSILNVRRAA